MPNARITVDAAVKERLADLADETGQRVDEFAEALLGRIAVEDVRFERGVPVLPRRPGAPTHFRQDAHEIEREMKAVIAFHVDGLKAEGIAVP